MRRVLFAVALVGMSAISHAQFTKEEQAALSDALFISNLSLADLSRSRATAGTPWTLNATADPNKGLEALSALSNSIKSGTPYQLLAHLRTEYFADGQLPSEEPVSAEVPDDVPAELRDSVSRLAKAILTCNERIRQGLQKLSPTERRTLIEAAPRFASLEAEPTFDFVKQPLPSRTEFNSLIAKVDFKYIRWAGQGLSQALQLEIPKLRESARQGFAGNLRATVEGVTVEIGGIGDDRHHENDVVLAIDLGGNDHYSGRYGAGVGYGSLCIDLGGDDNYEGPDLALGAGAFGVGLLYDMQGDDVYRGKSISLGSGIGGVGILYDDQGNDDFRTASLSAGFGAWGIGICSDSQGIDRYLSRTNSQGSARDFGVGILFDRSGEDDYRAAAGKCGSQGTGMGPGGFGLLLDAAGDDRYNAGYMVQGYGGSEGVGALMDEGGADVYVGAASCQGVGVGMGAGYLVDSVGQDTYLVTQSPGQGFGGDRGMGVLLDRSGDDLYAGGESHPAAAVGNGVAIFIDAGGDDRYQGPTGIGSMARGSGSLAAFVDLSGQDRYFEGLSDGQAKVESSWGSSLDI
ncbi:MAG TPA: hypothetical protein VJ835_01435, partial [Fimbriimonadaceae bacterium]|nr:hypothetical protein [Fimbriimonadaceae bacterium]